jgi:nucleotide-binding universal stress UspA family protein
MTTGMSGTPPGPRVVVGVEDSRSARWALAWAIGEARLRGMPLMVVHIAPFPEHAPQLTAGACGGIAPEVRAIGTKLIRSLLTEVAGGAPAGVEVFISSLLGNPGDALVRTAGEGDILVVGRGSRGGVSRLLTPSVGAHCARHAQGTLICVRPPTKAHLLGEPAGERSLLRRWLSLRRHTAADRARDD